MSFTAITLEKQDRIGTLTLNRPEKLNAISPTLMTEFVEALDQIEKDSDIKVVVVRGAGRAFSTGYDLGGGGWGDKSGKPFTIDDDRRILQWYIENWLRLRDLPKPVIAMVHGYCLAGATQLCICTDMIFVAENARIGFPSIPAGAGYVSAFWNWMVGPHRTKYLAFLPGSQITGKEAEAMGFATRAFPAEKLEEETYSYARRVAKVPAQKLQLEKMGINRAMDLRGFRVAVLSGAEYDAIFHFGPGNEEIRKIQKERGLRGAIQWYEEQ
ncbi:MAG: enoyl-CoA hydratase/isomerase family protein [Deltaproteobacteria bacterium]|nr:enoyl-CoA hydratase/isomerase family protein [Deltaproteobacteria bacterium]